MWRAPVKCVYIYLFWSKLRAEKDYSMQYLFGVRDAMEF